MTETFEQRLARINRVIDSILIDITHMPIEEQMVIGTGLLSALLYIHTGPTESSIAMAHTQLDEFVARWK